MSWLIPLILGGASYLGSRGKQQKPQATQYSTMSPQQESFQNKLLELLGGQLGGEGEEDFETFAAPFKRQFNEETIPGIAERFGGVGALSSSGFNQALSGAGAGLSERLASLKGGLNQQNRQMNLSKFQSLLPYAFQQGKHTNIQQGGGMGLLELLAPILQGYGGQLGSRLGAGNFGGGR